MSDIRIEYRTFLGIKREVEVKMPEKWGEMNAEQLQAVSRNYTGAETDDKLLADMLGVRKGLVKRLSDFQKFMIAEELLFMNEISPEFCFIIKELSGLVAPKARLSGISFGQFIFIESYYEKAVTKKDDVALDKFVACLYLPAGKEFNQRLIDERAGYVAENVGTDDKVAISLNYGLVMEWLSKQYPILFQKSKQQTIAKQSSGGGWVSIFESLVGDDIVNEDKYAALPLHTVLRYLTKKLKYGRR